MDPNTSTVSSDPKKSKNFFSKTFISKKNSKKFYFQSCIIIHRNGLLKFFAHSIARIWIYTTLSIDGFRLFHGFSGVIISSHIYLL